MRQFRIIWRWALAVALHAIVLVVILQVAESFFSGTVKELAEGILPQGIRLQDWLSYWESGWKQAIRSFAIIAAAVPLVMFLVWNIIFAIPNVIYKANKMAKILFFPVLLVVLVGEICMGLFYNPAMAIEGFAGTVPLFIGSSVFYLIGVTYLVPFLLSLIFCSPYCIASFKNWFRS